MDNIGIIITARVKSNRLKEKVLQEINGLTTIEILLNHVINDRYPVILAIPKNKDDDRLAEIAERKGVEVYRGEDDSPLHRLVACAEQNGFDHVVRVTADDILIDLSLLFLQIDFHLGRDYRDYTYMSRCPEGVAAEVIKVDALQKIVSEVVTPVEFISFYLKRPEFNYIEFYPPMEYQHSFRLTMDYEEDLKLLRTLFSLLRNPGTLDIVNLLKQNKYLLRINHLPKVTIYTPNYNTSKFIIDTMKSVLFSIYTDFEYIVIDDGSTDNSCNVISEFLGKLDFRDRQKITFIRNPTNQGQASTSNKVLEMARGKYIMCVDSDDLLLPDALGTMVEIIEAEHADVILGGYERINEVGEKTGESEKHNDKHLGCGLVVRRTINELKFSENIPYEVGTDFLNRLKNGCNITYINDIVWQYRKRQGQLTQNSDHPENKNGH
ncbi:MAG: glycosyltransferase [PVC group bacterium]|nr:glycosyltransferase [PVC group bacterium]